MNELSTVRLGEELDVPKLNRYLSEVLDINILNTEVLQFSGGYSNLTYLLKINYEMNLVLRKPPLGARVKSGHDMSREYNILNALYPKNIRVPRPIHFCNQTDVLNSEFYIMEYVSGWILRSDISEDNYPKPDQMKRIFDTFIDQFVAIHGFEYENLGLVISANANDYPERQIVGWTKRYNNAKTDNISSVEKLIKWLNDHIPASSGVSLIHNDFKYDNLILDAGSHEIKAILDWEMSTIGDPLFDMGSSLAYWINDDDPEWIQNTILSPTIIPGNPSREELLHAYAKKSGKDPGNGVLYYAYGMLKLAVIAQQIYARYKAGHTSNIKFAGLIKVVDLCGIIALQAIQTKKLDNLF